MMKIPQTFANGLRRVFPEFRYQIQNTLRFLKKVKQNAEPMTVAPLNFRPSTRQLAEALSQREENRLWLSHAFSLKGLILPGLFFLSAWLVLPYDPWISLHCHAIPHGEPEWLRNILDNVEPFGHGVGVVVASLLVSLLHPQRWMTGLNVFSAGVGGGLTADFFKLWVGRIRPRNFDFSTLNVQSTFTQFTPFLDGKSGSQSFPSAHAATAFGLAVMLSSLYPRARWLFFLLAILVMGHRLHSGAHYASDILTGAGIGWLIALCCIRFAVRFRYITEENCPMGEATRLTDA